MIMYQEIQSEGGSIVLCAVDEYGKRVKRTKVTHPYNYDGFIVWRCKPNQYANQTVYTDRLREWDREKNERLSVKHFGNSSDYWDGRKPEQVQAFLREYTENQNIEVVFMMEYCNKATGNPIWRIDYKM